jgi:hypothetical protein
MRQLKKLLLVLTPMGAAALFGGGGTHESFAELANWTPAATSEGAAPQSSFRNAKRVLVAAMLIGVAGYVGFGGTFANFQAETSNHGSSISSGTLTMSNTVNGGTACFSYNAVSADNVNGGCDAPFAITNVAPGTWQTTQVAKIVIQNTGSIDASKLYLYASEISGKLSSTGGLTQGTPVSSLSIASPGMEGTVANGDSITVSYNGKSQNFVVNGTVTAAANSNGGATTIPVTTQNANFTYPAGSTVTDTSGNTATTNTDCFDTRTSTNFNFNSISASTTQQAYNPFCGAVLMWVQELTGGKTYCWFGKGSTYSTGSSPSLTEDSNGRCTAPIANVIGGSGISGTITSIPVPAGLTGNVSSSDSIVVTQGSTTQTFTASAAAPVGSTSIPVNSQAVSGSFTGSAVGATLTDTTATGSLDSNATTDTITNFDTGHHQSAGRVELYPISSNGQLDTTVTHASELANSGSRTFYVGVYLPKPGGQNQNGLQGLASTFGLTWHMDQ